MEVGRPPEPGLGVRHQHQAGSAAGAQHLAGRRAIRAVVDGSALPAESGPLWLEAELGQLPSPVASFLASQGAGGGGGKAWAEMEEDLVAFALSWRRPAPDLEPRPDLRRAAGEALVRVGEGSRQGSRRRGKRRGGDHCVPPPEEAKPGWEGGGA